MLPSVSTYFCSSIGGVHRNNTSMRDSTGPSHNPLPVGIYQPNPCPEWSEIYHSINEIFHEVGLSLNPRLLSLCKSVL